MPDPSEWGEPLDPSQVVNPIVFQFRPNKFVKVKSDKLDEWEKLFVQHVGFAPAHHEQMSKPAWYGSPGGSVTGCNGGWDDCDD
ncbi:MAG: hypothetical protein ABR511_00980 [Acidimicrobiales bacterium]